MSNRRFFLIILGIVMVVAVWPYVSGRVIAPPGALFYGNQALAPADFSVYYSYIDQGRAGHFFMYDAFTSEPHQATLIQPVWFVVGQLSRIGPLDAPTIFALTRFALVPLLIYVLWWAAQWLWSGDVVRQRMGLVLSIISSGFGGLIISFSHGPMWHYPDLWVSEAFTILTLWSSPHFILVTAGIVFMLISLERSWVEQSWRRMLWAGLVAGLVVFIHPFHVLTWCLIATLLTIWHWIRLRAFPKGYLFRWAFVAVCTAPALLLYGLQLLYDPITIGRAVQNINLTRSFIDFLLGLGLPLIFILATFIRTTWRREYAAEKMQWTGIILLCYGIAVYLPVAFQRRLSQGLIIFVGWLAVPLATRLFTALWKKFSAVSFLVLMMIGLTLSFSWLYDLALVTTDHAKDLRVVSNMYYVSPEYQQLANVLRQTNLHQPILSTILEGNILAGLTAHQTYVGYAVETLDSQQKNATMARFYSSMTMSEQRQMLQSAGLCYVLDSPRTHGYGNAFVPANWSDLTITWRGSTMTLYRTPFCRS